MNKLPICFSSFHNDEEDSGCKHCSWYRECVGFSHELARLRESVDRNKKIKRLINEMICGYTVDMNSSTATINLLILKDLLELLES